MDYLSTLRVVVIKRRSYLMTVEAQLHADFTKAPAFVV